MLNFRKSVRNENTMCHSGSDGMWCRLHSHSWTSIIFNSGETESCVTPSGESGHTGPVYGSIPKQFENFYTNSTLQHYCFMSYFHRSCDLEEFANRNLVRFREAPPLKLHQLYDQLCFLNLLHETKFLTTSQT